MVKPEIKPIWNSSSFLVFTGGLTVLGAAISGLQYLSVHYSYRPYLKVHNAGHGTMVAWSLLFLVILYGIATGLRLMDRWLAAGIFAFVSVIVWAIFLVALFRWFGWDLNGASGEYGYTRHLGNWSWPRMLLWVLILVAAWENRRRFRFPFIRLISAVVFWVLLVDLFTTGHGTGLAVVSLLVGLLYLAVGNAIDEPSAFWLHLLAGALIGGALFNWFHATNTRYAFLLLFSVLFVFIAYWTKRSSWAVYGTLGFFAATSYYSYGSSRGLAGTFIGAFYPSYGYYGYGAASPWAHALAYGLLGFWLVGLGMLGKKWRKTHKQAPVVTTPAPPAATEPLAE